MYPLLCRAAALLGAAMLLANAAQAPARTSEPDCTIRAWVSDPDRAGTNVRATPSPHAAILARLPHLQRIGGESFAPEVEIEGFEQGWAKVRSARFADYGEGERLLFTGPGWIWGGLLTGSLTEGPTSELPIRASVGNDSRIEIEGLVVDAIDGCDGSYAHVMAHSADGRRAAGWSRLCPNQVTTCS